MTKQRVLLKAIRTKNSASTDLTFGDILPDLLDDDEIENLDSKSSKDWLDDLDSENSELSDSSSKHCTKRRVSHSDSISPLAVKQMKLSYVSDNVTDVKPSNSSRTKVSSLYEKVFSLAYSSDSKVIWSKKGFPIRGVPPEVIKMTC